MNTLGSHLWSSVGRKILMALTGLALALFVFFHLVGNLTLLLGAEAFNSYADFLANLGHGYFVDFADAGLVVFFLLHAYSGLTVYLRKRRARTQGYEVAADAGGASKKSLASRTMIVTGPIILVFLVLHVIHFKFGAGEAEGYTTLVHGAEARDLYRLVVEEFQKLPIMAGYVAVMVLLGFHLQHGVWSGFQSLGLTNGKTLPILVGFSTLFGLLLALGFIWIPVYIYFTGGGLS